MITSKTKALGAILALTATAICACAPSRDTTPNSKIGNQNDGVNTPAQDESAKLVRSDYKPGEVTILCDAAISDALVAIDKLVAVPVAKRNIETTLLAYEKDMADFGDKVNSLTFMGYVSRDKAISAEGSACEAKVGQFGIDIGTRRDVYEALKASTARTEDETRLRKKTLDSFEKSGLKLSDANLAKLKTILAEISKNQTKFSTNLNADTSTVELTAEELKGVSADFLSRLAKSSAGNYLVTTKSTDYTEVMENAVSAEARRKVLLAYSNRGGAENTKLLEATTVLRAKAAQLLGYKTWADSQTDGRMAKTSGNVLKFLNGLKTKLAAKNRAELQQLLAFKKQLDPKATKVDQWDISYLSTQLKKRDYSVDVEKIREYLPADVVVEGMFKVYSALLGVTYHEVKNAQVWSSDVKLYEIRNAKDDRRVGYFYADFVPREGKYGHAAAFPLVSGRLIDGEYTYPVASIVANFAPPSNGKPSLLPHTDVETLFHEFGHIMHQTLTRAPYASLSGSSTAQDFVEAPSQMLENWVWSPEILTLISGHYQDPSKKLPKEMLEKMVAGRNFGQGMQYTRQLLFALFDMKIHSITGAKAVDVTQTYNTLYREVMSGEPIPGGHFPQTFGHMMGGYDAGYYGYLWSKVYAQDMFSIFNREGLLSPVIGERYRSTILERGNMKDAIRNLKDFLGREPSPDQFFKELGI